MINNLLEYLKNKKILILGFGIEGISTYKFIRKYIKEQVLYIADKELNFNEKHEMLSEDKNIIAISGENYLKNLDEYDIIMKSPGISFANIDTTKFFNKIKSQLELFLEFIVIFIIGITGTKGKSTTSSLIYKMIEEQGKEVHLLGNIGVPLFDYIDILKEDTILVLEMSSHQLEYVEVSPKVSILLNLFEEHLDHYKSMQHYIDAKLNIYKFQKETDYFIYNIDNELLRKNVENLKPNGNVFEISYKGESLNNDRNKILCKENKKIVTQNNEVLYIDSENRKLLGNHNLNNIMFALAVAKILKLDLKKVAETINNFEPLPHRMEYVGEFNGIKYYNDSIATIPESTINTIETLKQVDTLIVGGMDRGIDYDEFIKYLNKSNIETLICMPDTGTYIAKQIVNPNMQIFVVSNLRRSG